MSTSLASIIIILFPDLILVPGAFYITKVLGTLGASIVGMLFSLSLLSFSLITIQPVIKKVIIDNPNRFSTFFFVLALALLISNIKITHQFSSIYITLVLPYILLALFISDSGLCKLGFGRLVLIAIGAVASSFIVLNYYLVHL